MFVDVEKICFTCKGIQGILADVDMIWYICKVVLRYGLRIRFIFLFPSTGVQNMSSDCRLYSTVTSLGPINLLDFLGFRLTLLTCPRLLNRFPAVDRVLHFDMSVERLLDESLLLIFSARDNGLFGDTLLLPSCSR